MDSETNRANLVKEQQNAQDVISRRISANANALQARVAAANYNVNAMNAETNRINAATSRNRANYQNKESESNVQRNQQQQKLLQMQTISEDSRRRNLEANTMASESQSKWYDTQSRYKGYEAWGSLLRGVGSVLNPIANITGDVIQSKTRISNSATSSNQNKKGDLSYEEKQRQQSEEWWERMEDILSEPIN